MLFVDLQTFGVDGVDHPLAARAEFDLKDATVSFIESRLNVKPETVGFRSGFASDVGQHAFVRQEIVSFLHRPTQAFKLSFSLL